MSTPRAGTPVTRPPEQEPPAPDPEQQSLSSPQNRRPIAADSSPKKGLPVPPVLDHLPSSVGKDYLPKAKDDVCQGNEDYDSVFQSSSLDTTTKPRNRRNRHQVLYHMVIRYRYVISTLQPFLPVCLTVNLWKSPSSVSIIKCDFDKVFGSFVIFLRLMFHGPPLNFSVYLK
jgi:hypothetical protein